MAAPPTRASTGTRPAARRARPLRAVRALPWAERARGELRASGESARSRQHGRAELLTPQELQVARYVAAGATSKEAAALLFLSPRTIDAHLRSIYAKLGIATRAHLREADLGKSASHTLNADPQARPLAWREPATCGRCDGHHRSGQRDVLLDHDNAASPRGR